MTRSIERALAVMLAASCVIATAAQEPQVTFRTGVGLVTVSATVSDASGRFVNGLTADDFIVYEDDRPQTLSYFNADRVPVSVALAVDSSNSMGGEKVAAARLALNQFFETLLDDGDDEILLYRFSDVPVLLQNWTSDRQLLSNALRRLTPEGGTAMYDAVREALGATSSGRHTKKAVVLISDGNDTSSQSKLVDLRQEIRVSDALVYAIGLDSVPVEESRSPSPPIRWPGVPAPAPAPFPPPPRRPGLTPQPPVRPLQVNGRRTGGSPNAVDRVNASALRELTDESGGRTEIVREAEELGPATRSIADELNQHYTLAYTATAPRDGRWHAIRVEVRRPGVFVRARSGYLAN